MQKIAIVIDSVCCPTKKQIEKYGFEIVPINVRCEGKVYRDYIDLTPTQAYQFLDKNPDDWATSAPSPGDFLTTFKKIVQKGTKEILCVTLSKNLSATWNSARLAADLLKNEGINVKIEIVDSQTVAAGQNILCLAAAKAAQEGKSFEETVELVKTLSDKARVFLLLETIRYVYRSGRIPEIASKIGAILALKPILQADQGKVHINSVTSSKEKSVEKLLKTLKETYDESFTDIVLMHADCALEAEDLKKKIIGQHPKAEIVISEFSPILGYATGRGTLLIGFFAKN